MPWVRKLDSGKWNAVVRLPNGRRTSKTDPLKGVVTKWALDLEAQLRRGEDVIAPSKVTVAQWYDEWWPPPYLGEHARASYATQWRLRVEPHWGPWQRGAIKQSDVVEWCDQLDRTVRVEHPEHGTKTVDERQLPKLEAAGWELAGRTVRAHEIARNLLSAMLRDAARKGLIRANPCDGVRPAKWTRKPPRWFTRDEAARLLAALDDPLMVDLDLHTGLRWAELAALRGLRIDRLRKKLIVQDVLMYDGRLRAYPKSHHSVREVPIPPHLVDPLLERAGKDLEAFLFQSPRGGPLLYHGWYHRVWRPALRKAELEGTPHHLRHTAASWLVQDGVDLYVVKEWLGHASLTTTEQYSHLDPDYLKAVEAAWRDTPGTHDPRPGDASGSGTVVP